MVVSRPTRYDGSCVGAGQDIVRSRVRIAVVSRTTLGVETTPSLGLVSLRPAVVELLRPDAHDVIATAHLSNRGTDAIPVTRTPRGFELDVPERTAAGSPIEWVEVTVEVRALTRLSPASRLPRPEGGARSGERSQAARSLD